MPSLLSAATALVVLTAFPMQSAAQTDGVLMVLVDRSASMADSGKWATARSAIVEALDDDALDQTSLGLIAGPTGTVPGPACLIFPIPLPCAVSSLPQVAIAPAGTQKSTAPTGVRRAISDWLVGTNPVPAASGDGFPLYATTVSAIAALQAAAGAGPRTLLIFTDGGISCTSVASPPRPAFDDAFGCPDFEHPDNLVALIDAARNDPATPVETLIFGLPGADSNGEGGSPPYSMKLALSVMASSGSDHTIPGCDSGLVFAPSSPDPTASCHHDLTTGFSAPTLSAAISGVVAAVTASLVPSYGVLGIAVLGTLLAALGVLGTRR